MSGRRVSGFGRPCPNTRTNRQDTINLALVLGGLVLQAVCVYMLVTGWHDGAIWLLFPASLWMQHKAA